MKYMLIWWLLSQPHIIHHGPCVEQDVAYMALVMKKLSHPEYETDVVPCKAEKLKARQ